MKLKYILLIIISLTALIQGQVLFNSSNTTYSTDFDFLPSTGTGTYSGYLAGEYWILSATRIIAANGGTTGTPGLQSLGNTSSIDRALGSKASSTTFYKFGLSIKNTNADKNIKFLKVQYYGEQWRSFAGITQGMIFDYKENPTGINDLDFNLIDELNFYPIHNTLNVSLNGNLSDNRIFVSHIFTVDLAPNNTILLRWNNEGTVLLGIDDFTVTAYYTDFPVPPTISPDVTLNTVDNEIELTFTDDQYWRESITSITVNDYNLSAGDYTISAGKITLHPSNGNDSLKAACVKNIVVKATGFNDASVSQILLPGTADAANSTVSISATLDQGRTSVITITAKDKYNNLVSGYVFKAAGVITSTHGLVVEEYTIHTSTGLPASTSDISLPATNSSGEVSFNVSLPAFINSGDGISVVSKLNDGTPLESGTFSYIKPAQQISTTGFDPGTDEVGQGSNSNILYRHRFDVLNDSLTLSNILMPVTGTYSASDIKTSGWKLWYSTDAIFDETDNLIASLSSLSSGGGENLSFSGNGQRFRIGKNYLILTADISDNASEGNFISFNTTTGATISFSETGAANSISYGTSKNHSVSPSTVLSAGDIAIIEFKTPSASFTNERLFTFIPLIRLNGGTKIQFTNMGWKPSEGFRSGESLCEWKAPAQGLLPGEAVSIWAINTNQTGTSKGSVTGDLSTFSNIDQLFAFTGSASSPNLITGISIGVNSWDSDAINATTSALPAALTNGVNAQFFPKSFGKLTKSSAGERLVFQQSLFNKSNWRLENDRFTDNTYHYKEEIKEVETGSNVVLPTTSASGIKSIEFEMVSKQGELKVMAFNSGAEDPVGVLGDVSTFRFVVENQGVEFNNCTLKFNLSDLPNLVINEGAEDIKLYKRETVGSGTFTEVGLLSYHDNGTAGDQSDDWLEISGISSFSEFVFGSEGGNLPVELTSFTGESRGDKVKLRWHTEMELNNAGFEIQRKANEKSDWVKAGFVNGSGTTYTPQDYSWEEKAPAGCGKISYRLKQIDTDGTFDYSDEISVDILISDFVLYQNYPNPFNPETVIKFALPYDGKVRMVVYNAIGELVSVLKDDLMTRGYHSVSFDASDLVSGLYILRMQTGGKVLTRKMMLMR